jgi:hypothetical protein
VLMKTEIELYDAEIIDAVDVEMTKEQYKKFKALEEDLSVIWNKRHKFVQGVINGTDTD